jgi:hypothetical protein
MTYPKPGEIVLTDPTTGDVVTETYDHVDAHEHYVTCQEHVPEDEHDRPGTVVDTVVRYPWHRVVAVGHEYDYKDDGPREYAHPEDWE